MLGEKIISLKDVVGKGYTEFWNFKGRYRICKGSRASKKSKTTAMWFIYNTMKYPEANTLVIRKTFNTLRTSVFTDLKWAIHRLGVDEYWSYTNSPLEMTYKPTGQKIYFRGLDDPLKITSISVDVGVLCWCWFEEFFEVATEEDFNNIFKLCNSNPRDLWDIFDKLFHAQFELDSSCTSISHEAVINGLQCFVENFSFYEYYPKKKKARKNTNDIYSYIKHLLTLNNPIEFTNDELRTSASTGGSTTNYITGMMNIGLVSKTDTKRPGGSIVYKINDPKVQYAISNKIIIKHL